jgi:hypothetical protein
VQTILAIVASWVLVAAICLIGLRACTGRVDLWGAVVLGAGKLVLGIVGFPALFMFHHDAILFTISYVVTSWFEWGYLEAFVADARPSVWGCLVGYTPRSRAWRCGAIVTMILAWLAVSRRR